MKTTSESILKIIYLSCGNDNVLRLRESSAHHKTTVCIIRKQKCVSVEGD